MANSFADNLKSLKDSFFGKKEAPETPGHKATVSWSLLPGEGRVQQVLSRDDAEFTTTRIFDYKAQTYESITQFKGQSSEPPHKFGLSAADPRLLDEATAQFNKLGGVVTHAPRTWNPIVAPQDPAPAAPQSPPQKRKRFVIDDISVGHDVAAPEKASFRKMKR